MIIFDSLADYYDFIDNDKTLPFDIFLSSRIRQLIDKIDDESQKVICSYEMYFTDYSFEGGELKPQSQLEGQIYPTLDVFNDDFEYIKARALQTTNSKYKAKYNHLLWSSKHRHSKYAEEAVENYFQFLKSSTIPTEDVLSHEAFKAAYLNLFKLSEQIDHRRIEVIEYIFTVLGKNIINAYAEYSTIKYIVTNAKKVEKEYVKRFYDYVEKAGEDVDSHFKIEYLELLITIATKIKLPTQVAHISIAEILIDKAEKNKDNFTAHDFYLNAVLHFQKAGEKKKVEETTVLMEKSKRNLNFKSVGSEYTSEALQNIWNRVVSTVEDLTSNSSSEDIYQYLIRQSIFPNAELLNQTVKPLMYEFMRVVTFDNNMNITNNSGGISPYFIHIDNFSMRHLSLVFSKGIKSGKVNHFTLIDYLKNHTWYGQDFTYINNDGEKDGFDWIELLSPSLENFFLQSEIDIRQNLTNNQKYILPIDSLVVKFEGLLRQFSRINEAQTIEVKDSETKERISFERLLENEKLKDILPADDIALFKFLFTTDGVNLRNNFAHCFYKTKNYNPGVMFLLITAMLRLGNYELKSIEKGIAQE